MVEMRKGAANEGTFKRGKAACDIKIRAKDVRRVRPANYCGACCGTGRSKLICGLRSSGRHEVSGPQTAFTRSRRSGGYWRHAEWGVTRLDCRAVAHHVHCRKFSIR